MLGSCQSRTIISEQLRSFRLTQQVLPGIKLSITLEFITSIAIMTISLGDAFAWVLNVTTCVAIVFVNKLLMDPIHGQGFVFATCLSAVHFLTTGFVFYMGELCGMLKAADLPTKQLVVYTVVAAISIASVNLSLLYNSVGFYQISKLATIPVVASIEYVWFGRRFSIPTIISMAAVALGSGIVTVSDVSLTALGFIIAVISVVTAALQQIGAGTLQRANKVGPIETLAATAPMQGMWLATFGPSLDYSLRHAWVFTYTFTWTSFGIMVLSCCVALLVNLSQFMCLGRFSAATFQVMSHTKTISVLLLGWAFLGDVMTPRKVIGIITAMGGMAAFSYFSSIPLPSPPPAYSDKDDLATANVCLPDEEAANEISSGVTSEKKRLLGKKG